MTFRQGEPTPDFLDPIRGPDQTPAPVSALPGTLRIRVSPSVLPPMKLSVPLLAGLVMAAPVPLSAQTFTPEDYGDPTEFYAERIIFQTDRGTGYTNSSQLAGMNRYDVVGAGRVYDFCAEFFVHGNENTTYLLTPGLDRYSGAQQNAIRALFSNALPEFLSLYSDFLVLEPGGTPGSHTAEYNMLQGYGAGMQTALWEIINETNAIFSIDNNLPDSGVFRTDFDARAPGTRENYGVQYAQTFLTKVQDGEWTDQGELVYFVANAIDPSRNQDRIWIQLIPEPSSVLLGLMGLALALRRHR